MVGVVNENIDVISLNYCIRIIKGGAGADTINDKIF